MANAQAVGEGAVAYDPEIGIVYSGQVIDASAVVSYDRKWVHLTMGVQESRPIAIVSFPVIQTPGQGFVGGAMPTGVLPPNSPIVQTSPTAISMRATAMRSVLSQTGTYQLARLPG